MRVTVIGSGYVGLVAGACLAETGNDVVCADVDTGKIARLRQNELPIYEPATTEAFATYGVLDEGTTVQPVLAPDGVIPEFGGLEITTSSTSPFRNRSRLTSVK